MKEKSSNFFLSIFVKMDQDLVLNILHLGKQ